MNALTMGHSVQKEPHGYLLVDTFRTARETLVDRFLQMEHGDVISVFADDFLKDHPHADELRARYGAEAASHAQAFRQKVAEEAHAYFEKHKLDLVQKEVEIPYWQDVFVRMHGINLSEVLKDALVDLWKKTGGHL